jgi:hypothetical protein
MLKVVMFCSESHVSGGTAAKAASCPMQKFFDKWFLPVVFVLIGGAMVWAIWRG